MEKKNFSNFKPADVTSTQDGLELSMVRIYEIPKPNRNFWVCVCYGSKPKPNSIWFGSVRVFVFLLYFFFLLTHKASFLVFFASLAFDLSLTRWFLWARMRDRERERGENFPRKNPDTLPPFSSSSFLSLYFHFHFHFQSRICFHVCLLIRSLSLVAHLLAVVLSRAKNEQRETNPWFSFSECKACFELLWLIGRWQASS